MLWLMRKLRLRSNDSPPDAIEILVPLLLWSFVFELWLPKTKFFAHYDTSDYADVFWYSLGALISSLVWRVCYGTPSVKITNEPLIYR
jgi:hypothetical protein